ncbi:MAG: 20S proteasome, alpha subunit [Haloquadratum sp. J07HQX50]|jgi:20S proteasome, alpha and beta subunits|nr:MAG: 20S proteasome, alpha subunit [Haloquadratum sp. J07HQX50]
MQRNDQQAYDRGTSLFSPDGRIYQVEYAREAVNRGAPSLGIRTSESVILAARRQTSSSLMEAESIEKLHKLDEFIGAASAGHVADARKLIDEARTAAQRNRLRYGEPIGAETLTRTLSDEIQETTQIGGTRPFGAALLIGGYDNTNGNSEPRLFETDPSGAPQEWKAIAIGNNRESIQEFLEDEWGTELTTEGGVDLAIQALLEADEEIERDGVTVGIVDADGYTDYPADNIGEKIETFRPAESDE